MQTLARRIFIYSGFLTLICFPFSIFSSVQDGTPSHVLGQRGFYSDKRNGLGPDGVWAPARVAIDPSTNRIYVADTSNSRVVWWNSVSSLVTGQEADGVIGQRDLNSNDWDETPTAASLDYPTGVAVDAAGNLWVVDHEDSWILKFSAPVVSAASATLVLGQNDFISDSINMGGLVGSNTLNRPFFLHVDNNDVWVSDWGNHRILRFTNPTMNGAAASLVLGQSDFLSNSANKGGAVSDSGLNYPYDFFVSSAGLV